MAAPKHSLDWEAISLRLVFGALATVAILFLVGPTLIMLLTSFTASQALKFPPDGLSLRWYVALLDADQMQAAAWNSLVVAFWTTVFSVVLGTAAALGIARNRSVLARACDVLFMSPLLLPALAFGFAALIFIHKLGFGRASRFSCSDTSSFACRSCCARQSPRSPSSIRRCSMPPTASAAVA